MLSKSNVAVLRPSLSSLILLGVLVSFGPILALLTFYYNDGQIYGIIAAVGALLLWGSVATLRIEIHSEWLEKKVFWCSRWKIAIADAALSEGSGGDIRLIPAIIISDRSRGRRVGEILKPLFRTQDLVKFLSALPRLS